MKVSTTLASYHLGISVSTEYIYERGDTDDPYDSYGRLYVKDLVLEGDPMITTEELVDYVVHEIILIALDSHTDNSSVLVTDRDLDMDQKLKEKLWVLFEARGVLSDENRLKNFSFYGQDGGDDSQDLSDGYLELDEQETALVRKYYNFLSSIGFKNLKGLAS